MNLTMLLDMAVDGFGDRILIGSRTDGFTAAQLAEMAAHGADMIRLADADALLYLAVNGPAFPVALFAAARAGVPLVPVNYRLGSEQLQALLSNHPLAIGIADKPHIGALREAGLTTVHTPEAWLSITSTPTDGASTHGFTVETGQPSETDEPAPAVIIYTSGTTSAPKGVLLRHENLTSYVFGSVEFGSSEESDSALISVPPYHIAAVANAITSLYAGRRTMVLEQFTPTEWLDIVKQENITNALVVPTMLARIVEVADGIELPSLRALAYGGAPMPISVIEKAMKIWQHVDFVNAYGLTETSSTVAVLGPDDHRAAVASDEPAVRARLASVGRPVPGVDIQIRDDDGQVLAAGQHGTIWIRGEQVSAEYAGLGRALDDQGFFNTRDHGFFDADGYLFVGGRNDDTIIRGAENIAPAEIEDVLLRHPAVLDAAVVGVPDEEWGQRIEAVVVLRPDEDTDADELRAHVRATLRSSKTPERVFFWPELPRTETGKLVRRRVLERMSDAPATPVAP
ncbi:fatty acid--CoA ligase family protein [[Mycobacterium] wendilense]|uniref:Fatty acid--CoA ligase family protein n=1 Tax=[Mycobacterium] wendilense TaxID=3064284 RepID=A0ABN9P375_9MYCO|nr:fatty acid--CoA ligase family protein [Mycolicibacterium sp. MU0050]CAJ1586041.1 fatty acid--CoA ligase family protein [Mycolicibacterium sp. MU0050]